MVGIPVICQHDGCPLTLVSPSSCHCDVCNRTYSMDKGVLRLLDEPDKFYEGTYGGQIKFSPISERPWYVWPLWLINSGYLWQVRKHVAEGRAVVELGCAGGVRYFGKRYHMVGCDLSLASLQKLEGVYDQLIQSDICTGIPLPDHSVDAIVSSFFWEHISPSQKPHLLNECFRVLRPGGKIIFLYDVETRNPLIQHYKKQNPSLYQRLFIEGDGHLGYQSPNDNLALFRHAGFQVILHQGLEKTWLQSSSTYSKLIEFDRTTHRLLAWTKYLGYRPWFYIYTALMRVVDAVICPFLPRDFARIDLVVLQKKSR